ncbi:hypothetical protein BGW39_000014 [Mortierella sp. 14UC]|nr:hypothetical protein BGW39_000014 [Mortierella sp. 14UC]
MIGIKSTLSLMCLLVGTMTFSFAAPVVGSEADVVVGTQLTKRSFNPRQKWQSDELNCVQILDPSPGATYHPGYFVRLNYGAGECDATAAGPWTIHLYNSLDIQGGQVSYDYHEAIASGYKTQYLWTIPNNQNSKAKNVKKANEYYVRIETNSQEGVKLGSKGGLRTLADDITQPLEELKLRQDTPELVAGPDNTDFLAEFALRPNRPAPAREAIYTPTPAVISAPAASKAPDAPATPAAPIAPAPVTPPATSASNPNDVVTPKDVKDVAGSGATDYSVPVDIDVASDSNGSKIQVKDSKDKTADIAAPGLPSSTDIASGTSDTAPAAAAPISDPAASNGVTDIPAITEIPEPHKQPPPMRPTPQ